LFVICLICALFVCYLFGHLWPICAEIVCTFRIARVEQLAASQDQMAREIEKLQAADMEFLKKSQPLQRSGPHSHAQAHADSAIAFAGSRYHLIHKSAR
jgi:hypothetical protein